MLALDDVERRKWQESSDIVKSLKSVYRMGSPENEKFYNVIPNLVFQTDDGKDKIHTCSTCRDALTQMRCPSICIKNGFDFGCVWNTDLPELSLAEMTNSNEMPIYFY